MSRFKRIGGLSRLSDRVGGGGGFKIGGGYLLGFVIDASVTYGLIVSPAAGETFGLAYRTGNAGTDPVSLTNGPANTAHMEAQTYYPAGLFCAGLSIGGYTDWYLPAQNEMLSIMPNAFVLAGTPDELSYDTYWSSTSQSASATSSAMIGTKGSTTALFAAKSQTARGVRAIRRVAVTELLS